MMQEILPGLYRHYKGPQYHVLEVATHSETEQRLVVYRALYGERGLWVRPLLMFTEQVEVAGKLVARFEYVGEYVEEHKDGAAGLPVNNEAVNK